DDYYAVGEDGEVVLWADGELTEETWDSVWTWARDVWLDT
ncbi:SMI1/KNR4 family protein, partial [Pseudomonas sp. ATCC 13867]